MWVNSTAQPGFNGRWSTAFCIALPSREWLAREETEERRGRLRVRLEKWGWERKGKKKHKESGVGKTLPFLGLPALTNYCRFRCLKQHDLSSKELWVWAGLVPAGGSRENLFFCLLHLWRLSGLSSYLTSLPLLLPLPPLPLVLPVITAIIPNAEQCVCHTAGTQQHMCHTRQWQLLGYVSLNATAQYVKTKIQDPQWISETEWYQILCILFFIFIHIYDKV